MAARDPHKQETPTGDQSDDLVFRPLKGRLYSRRDPNIDIGSFESDIVLAKPIDVATLLALLGRVDEPDSAIDLPTSEESSA